MTRPFQRSLRRPALLTALVVGASLLAAVPAAPVALGAPGCKVTNARTGGSKATLTAAVTAERGGDTLEIRGTCFGRTDLTKSLKLVGKPSTYMMDAVMSLLRMSPGRCLITGDRLETDVQMGLNAGMASALALTGATKLAEAETSPTKPTYIIKDLGELVDW